VATIVGRRTPMSLNFHETIEQTFTLARDFEALAKLSTNLLTESYQTWYRANHDEVTESALTVAEITVFITALKNYFWDFGAELGAITGIKVEYFTRTGTEDPRQKKKREHQESRDTKAAKKDYHKAIDEEIKEELRQEQRERLAAIEATRRTCRACEGYGSYDVTCNVCHGQGGCGFCSGGTNRAVCRDCRGVGSITD